jgi:flavodoxin
MAAEGEPALRRHPRVLLVYYSRSGVTKRLAQIIEQQLECDIEELTDTRDRSGVIGYLRSVVDALNGSLTRLEPTRNDPSDYDLIVIGTPVWMWRVSSPVRTYITENAARFRNVAFFLTYFTSGSSRVHRQLADICGRQPVATLSVRAFLVGRSQQGVRRFVKEINQSRSGRSSSTQQASQS